LLLAGRERDRVPSLALPHWARLLGVRLDLLGPLEDPAPLYHAGDALVLPSFAEGMPNVILEAQLCGLPVVVTAQANCDGLVVHGETGLVVPTGDVRALARALGEIVALSADDRRAMGARGRARISAWLARNDTPAAFARLYEDAISGR
jgi:glycosyltransferase involved in cell wall biosynthesis